MKGLGGGMAGMLGLLLASFGTGVVLSRFNALAVLVASVLVSVGAIIFDLVQGAVLVQSLVLGFTGGLALQAGYLAGQVIGRRSGK